MNELIKTTDAVSMTTVEIAEMTGKRSDHVKRDAEKMLLELHGKEGLPSFGETYIHPQNKQEYECYRLPKREILILVSGYSISLRAKIIDRLEELERAQKILIPDFRNPAEAARAWAFEYEKNEVLQIELKKAQPAIDFVKVVTAEAKSIRIGEYAKLLSDVSNIVIPVNKLFQFFRDRGYLMVGRDNSERNKPYQSAITKGWFELKMERPQPHIVVCVTYITGAGQFRFKDDVIAHFS